MIRAALYARVSSASQAEENSVSIDEQFTEMERYCQEKGYQVVGRYRDVASGSTRNRPRFQQMLADGRDGKFDVVVCWKSDRLSRGIYPAAALMEVVESHGIRLESVADHLDESTFAIYAAVGKMEIDNFRERSALGKRGAARKGRWPIGSVPYGYLLDEDGRPQVNESEAFFVREAFDRYVGRRHGPREIARWLDDAGAPRRKGSKYGKWFYTQVTRMLSQPAYRGEAEYGKKRYKQTESGRRVSDQPEQDWIPVPFPRLVDEETFDLAQEIKKEHSRYSKRNTRKPHLLQGLVVCEECGLRFSVLSYKKSTVKRKDGSRYTYEHREPLRYYNCRGVIDHKLGCRERSHIRAEKLEGLVWDSVKQLIQQPGSMLDSLHPMVESTDTQQLQRELEDAEIRLRAIEDEETRLNRLFVSGRIDEDQLDVQQRFITERKEAAVASLAAARAQLDDNSDSSETARAAQEYLSSLDVGLDTLNVQEQQELLRALLKRVSINRDRRVKLVVAVPLNEQSVDEKQARSSRLLMTSPHRRTCWL